MARKLSNNKEGLILLEIIDILDKLSEKSLYILKDKIDQELGTKLEEKDHIIFLNIIINELKSIGIVLNNKLVFYYFIEFVVHIAIKYISNNYINNYFSDMIKALIKHGLETGFIDKADAKKLRHKIKYLNNRSLSINNICHVINEEFYYVLDYSFPGYANSEFFINTALERFKNK